MTLQERQQTIDDMRTMLDWLEANPSVSIPDDFDQQKLFFGSSKDEFLATARTFGTFEKADGGFSKELVKITKRFGVVSLSAFISRDAVCKKVIVQKLVDVEEWDCEPLLSGTEISELNEKAEGVAV